MKKVRAPQKNMSAMHSARESAIKLLTDLQHAHTETTNLALEILLLDMIAQVADMKLKLIRLAAEGQDEK